MKLKFWTWLRDYCEIKMADCHAAWQRCPHCRRCTFAVGGWAEMLELDNGLTRVRCMQCLKCSDWDMGAPVAILVGKREA